MEIMQLYSRHSYTPISFLMSSHGEGISRLGKWTHLLSQREKHW